MKNIGFKILSILIAILLYLHVNDRSNVSSIRVAVPIVVDNLAINKTISRPSNLQTFVTISGPSFKMADVANQELAFRVVLPEDVSDHYRVKFTPEQLGLPPSLDVVVIEPSEMELVFDTTQIDNLPIVIPRVGILSEDQELVEIRHNPKTVQVKCPSKEMKKITSVESAPIDLATLNKSGVINKILLSPSSACTLSESEVRVTVVLSSTGKERSFKDLPIEVRGSNLEKLHLSQSKVSVEVSGSQDNINALKNEMIKPYIQIDQSLKDSSYTVKVEVPRGINVIYIDPEKVKVTIPK